MGMRGEGVCGAIKSLDNSEDRSKGKKTSRTIEFFITKKL
jgi:hypothetical protein